MAAMQLVTMTLLVMDELRIRMRTIISMILLVASTRDVDIDDEHGVTMPLRFAWSWSH